MIEEEKKDRFIKMHRDVANEGKRRYNSEIIEKIREAWIAGPDRLAQEVVDSLKREHRILVSHATVTKYRPDTLPPRNKNLPTKQGILRSQLRMEVEALWRNLPDGPPSTIAQQMQELHGERMSPKTAKRMRPSDLPPFRKSPPKNKKVTLELVELWKSNPMQSIGWMANKFEELHGVKVALNSIRRMRPFYLPPLKNKSRSPSKTLEMIDLICQENPDYTNKAIQYLVGKRLSCWVDEDFLEERRPLLATTTRTKEASQPKQETIPFSGDPTPDQIREMARAIREEKFAHPNRKSTLDPWKIPIFSKDKESGLNAG